MRALSSITAIACASLLAAACGSKQKTDDSTQRAANPGADTDKAPKATGTELAEGALRDALLHLRRVHFAYDTDTLQPAAREALAEAAERLASSPNVHIYIDGHTDDRGTEEYNLALGDRRGRAVSDYLANLGIEAERLHVVTFGKETLMTSGSDAVARARNRRVEFRLMRGDVRIVLDEGQLYDDKGTAIAAPSAP